MTEESRCPKCGSLLEDEKREGGIVQQCAACSGRWFSADAVARTVTGTGPKINPQVTLYELSRLATGKKVRAEGLRCPDCRTSTLDMHVYVDVDVEFRKRCYGLCLDGGELQKIHAHGQRVKWKERRDELGAPLRIVAEFLS